MKSRKVNPRHQFFVNPAEPERGGLVLVTTPEVAAQRNDQDPGERKHRHGEYGTNNDHGCPQPPKAC